MRERWEKEEEQEREREREKGELRSIWAGE